MCYQYWQSGGRSYIAQKSQTGQGARPDPEGLIFGTFKKHIRQILIAHGDELTQRLTEFQFWYNAIRPHQNLKGQTPDEIWHGRTIPQTKNWTYIEFWNGVLRGFYARE